MSSSTSRAPPSAGGRQQQPNSRSHLQPNSYRSSQSPPTNSKVPQHHTPTSYPSHTLDNLNDSTVAQDHSGQDSFVRDTQAEKREPQTTTDLPSQYFYGNYLTPDHGSENPFSESSYTSPSIDEFLWQESFNTSQGLDEFGNDGTLVNSVFTDIDTNGDLQGILPLHSQQGKEVPVTTLDIGSSTPRMAASSTTVSVMSQPSKAKGESSKRARTPDDDEHIEEDRLSRSTSNQQGKATNTVPLPQIVKPTVLISTYNRGDSPARTEGHRSLSRRSQGSRLSNHQENAATETGVTKDSELSTSRLMPPNQYASETWDDEEDEEVDRAGVAPTKRDDATVPSLKDMEKQRELDENRAGVESWLATSEAGSTTGLEPNTFRTRIRRERMRSRSAGARDHHGEVPFNNPSTPGPGVLLDVDSASDYSDDGGSYISSDGNAVQTPESPAADTKPIDPFAKGSYFPPVDDNIAPEDTEPLPNQFIRRQLWQDPVRGGPVPDRGQPASSNHAIVQYEQMAARFETASRAATWGTRRRLSDSEIASIVDGSKVRHMSLSNKARDRGNSIINRARTVIRRSSSTIKKSKENVARQPSPTSTEKVNVLDNDQSHTATSPIQQVQRTFSWGKSKSPPLSNTGGALMAMTGQLTAIGGSTATPSVEPPERPKSPFLSALKRSRSKSDLPKAQKGTPGLSDLFNRHGGPPVPTLASPLHLRGETSEATPGTSVVANADDDMDEDQEDEIPIKMELLPQNLNIIPNLDGFRTHARQLNPRLDAYLVERIAHDQLRRYKKLVKNKVEHTRNVQYKRQCTSGRFCIDLGGKPNILPPRTSAKDANVNYSQFKVGNAGDSDGEEGAFVEGVVTPALFPAGIPLPPTTHLPAEFECPLCFQVKKFQKPSDWTKHVHEDVQPFSCTFPNCPEPKSFKRKADWVRHENERHRHLEWWRCNIQECAHVCYRKDNFVQHLVREHKMNEPSKGQRTAGSRNRPMSRSAPQLGQDPDTFWQLVEHCRHDTSQTPRNEPCKFCGNICSTWKKLSVHVGKHMEQIAMPVLDLAAKRSITADTIISPIDPPNQRMAQPAMLDVNNINTSMNSNNLEALSPYSASAVSGYQNSSAGHSPVPMHATHSHSSSVGQPFYDQSMMQGHAPHLVDNMQQYGDNAVAQNYPYSSYDVVNGPNYIPTSHHGNAYTQQPTTQTVPANFHPQQVPRSQPMDAGYGALSVDTIHASMYNQDQYYPNSAPGNSYMGGFAGGVNHASGMHSPHHGQAGNLHSAVSGGQPVGNDFLYAHHPNGANGGHFYQ